MRILFPTENFGTHHTSHNKILLAQSTVHPHGNRLTKIVTAIIYQSHVSLQLVSLKKNGKEKKKKKKKKKLERSITF